MPACVCGSGVAIEDCCAALFAGRPAPTAEALMRSRYSAYVTGNLDYLERTCAPEALEQFNRLDAERFAEKAKWLGLEIKRVEGGGANDQTGKVEFVFRYELDGQVYVQCELAEFCRGKGTWLYKDSVINPKPSTEYVEKIGRNDPCPCGSGKKHKKCCGA